MWSDREKRKRLKKKFLHIEIDAIRGEEVSNHGGR